MLKSMSDRVWAFDAEWVPDPAAGRCLYKLDDSMDDRQVVEHMFKKGGATPDNPTPYLKVCLCRVVSISVVVRRARGDDISLDLRSIPTFSPDVKMAPEADILSSFLNGIGSHTPQLVGFNSLSADIKIMLQRAFINGVSVPSLFRRPAKPWEGADYFARDGEYHVDLYTLSSLFSAGGPSLHQLAELSGIPGKLESDGAMVFDLWLNGKIKEIVEYNETDALTTYLLWLRLAYLSGFFTKDTYAEEQCYVDQLIDTHISNGSIHLKPFKARWYELGGPSVS